MSQRGRGGHLKISKDKTLLSMPFYPFKAQGVVALLTNGYNTC